MPKSKTFVPGVRTPNQTGSAPSVRPLSITGPTASRPDFDPDRTPSPTPHPGPKVLSRTRTGTPEPEFFRTVCVPLCPTPKGHSDGTPERSFHSNFNPLSVFDLVYHRRTPGPGPIPRVSPMSSVLCRPHPTRPGHPGYPLRSLWVTSPFRPEPRWILVDGDSRGMTTGIWRYSADGGRSRVLPVVCVSVPELLWRWTSDGSSDWAKPNPGFLSGW